MTNSWHCDYDYDQSNLLLPQGLILVIFKNSKEIWVKPVYVHLTCSFTLLILCNSLWMEYSASTLEYNLNRNTLFSSWGDRIDFLKGDYF